MRGKTPTENYLSIASLMLGTETLLTEYDKDKEAPDVEGAVR